VLLKTVTLEGLLVLDLFLRVFVSLQNLVVLLLAFLKELVHLIFELLSKSIHLVLLLLHEFSLCGENLLVSHLHMATALFFFDFVGTLLNLMGLLVIFLLSQVLLNLTHVEKLCRLFEFKRQGLLESGSILLQLLGVPDLKLLKLLLVLLLSLREYSIPVLVELLVLLDVSLLDLFLALLMLENELLVLHVELLLFEFKDAVLRHLGLNVSTLCFTGLSMLLHRSAIVTGRVSP